ncbi:MAG TPA: type II secretion system F family protein [Kiloniellaceae bacterium]|nr:type II secretion system F family protein [Kiloniellaceae bacterium]
MQYVNATIEQITNFLIRLTGDSSWLVLLVIFAAVFLAVVALGALLSGRNPVERRLAGNVNLPETVQQTDHLRRKDKDSPWTKLLESIEKRFSPTDDRKRSSVSQKMIQAGYYAPSAVRNFYVVRVFCAAGFPLAFLLFQMLVPSNTSIERVLFLTAVICFAGLVLPSAWVNRRIATRQLEITEGFPDALDMLVVCVEAGLGLDAAFNRVGTQFAKSHPILAEHFGLVALEFRAGKTRSEAMRSFASRIGLAEINSFVTLLIQSEALGTSIAQTLRVHSEEMRAKRMLRAEEKAQRLPVLLSIPLVLGILPAMLCVSLLPGVIRIIRILIPALTGH